MAAVKRDLVQDTTGAVVVAFWRQSEFPGVFSEEHPVLAWIVEWVEDEEEAPSVIYVKPIVTEDLKSAKWCIRETVDGHYTWRFLAECSFTEFDKAQEYALERWLADEQAKRDRVGSKVHA